MRINEHRHAATAHLLSPAQKINAADIIFVTFGDNFAVKVTKTAARDLIKSVGGSKLCEQALDFVAVVERGKPDPFHLFISTSIDY
jgi:hypothetical protein